MNRHTLRWLLALALILVVMSVAAQDEEDDGQNTATVVDSTTVEADLPVITPGGGVEINRLDGYLISNASPINVRTGDGVEFQPVALLLGGVNLEATGQNDRGTWWRVRSGTGIEGWVNAELLIVRGDLTGVPVIDTSDMGERATIEFLVYGSPALSSSDSDDFDDFICNLAPGEYEVLGVSDGGDYYQVVGVCESGAQEVGYVSLEEGALRNPTGRSVPRVGQFFLPLDTDNLNDVQGPSLLVFLRQTVYSEPDARPSTSVCDIFPNRYPIVGRDSEIVSFYLIEATCLDGSDVTAWIGVDTGAFQNLSGDPFDIPVVDEPVIGDDIPEREPRFVVFIERPLLDAPNGDVICTVQPGAYQVVSRTVGSSEFRVIGQCNGLNVVGYLDGDDGALRNPFSKDIEIES